MVVQRLTNDWQFQQVGSDDWLPAVVPGGVDPDLMASGKIPDPFVADNKKMMQWVAETDWEYKTTFMPDAEILA